MQTDSYIEVTMQASTAHIDIVKMLQKNGGKMKKDDLLRSFTGGEWPSANLLCLISDGIKHLINEKKVILFDDTYVLQPNAR